MDKPKTKKKVVFAQDDWIAKNREAVNKLILLVAEVGFPRENPQEFLANCFVSDESTLGDFLDEEGLKKLGDKLGGITLNYKNRIWETALLLSTRNPA